MNEQRLRNFMTLLYEAGMSHGAIVEQGYRFALALTSGQARASSPVYETGTLEEAASLLRSASIAMNLHVACDLERMDRLTQLTKCHGGML